MMAILNSLMRWAVQDLLWLYVVYNLGEGNITADFLSRKEVGRNKWELSWVVSQQVGQSWRVPQVYLMATYLNGKLPKFYSRSFHAKAVAQDALCCSWEFQ